MVLLALPLPVYVPKLKKPDPALSATTTGAVLPLLTLDVTPPVYPDEVKLKLEAGVVVNVVKLVNSFHKLVHGTNQYAD
jgi:hypothetical protein